MDDARTLAEIVLYIWAGFTTLMAIYLLRRIDDEVAALISASPHPLPLRDMPGFCIAVVVLWPLVLLAWLVAELDGSAR